MDEQPDTDEQSQGLQGAAPLLVSVAAGAAAGALAVLARKAFSGGGGDDDEEAGEGSKRKDPTAFADLERVADDLEGLVSELRSASQEEPDFRRLVELTDAISEYADQAANAFHQAATSDAEGEESERRVTDELMSRVAELTRGGGERAASGSRREERKEKETARR